MHLNLMHVLIKCTCTCSHSIWDLIAGESAPSSFNYAFYTFLAFIVIAFPNVALLYDCRVAAASEVSTPLPLATVGGGRG
jgi:hypothetical protein